MGDRSKSISRRINFVYPSRRKLAWAIAIFLLSQVFLLFLNPVINAFLTAGSIGTVVLLFMLSYLAAAAGLERCEQNTYRLIIAITLITVLSGLVLTSYQYGEPSGSKTRPSTGKPTMSCQCLGIETRHVKGISDISSFTFYSQEVKYRCLGMVSSCKEVHRPSTVEKQAESYCKNRLRETYCGRDGINGTEWAQEAEFKGQTCAEWNKTTPIFDNGVPECE